MRSHLLHMLVYATRQTPRAQLRLGVMLWLAMVGGALFLAYLMYPFPG